MAMHKIIKLITTGVGLHTAKQVSTERNTRKSTLTHEKDTANLQYFKHELTKNNLIYMD
jgi:hypothetical protein